MEVINIVDNLRKRVCQYRLEKTGIKEISTHLNSVDIVLALVDLGIKDKRPISKEEECWFRAGLYLSYVFANSEWEDIYIEFDKLVNAVEKENYFRK
ncbi:MAG: hypothetical protein WBO38_09965 [Chitinophagaceae bacterium]